MDRHAKRRLGLVTSLIAAVLGLAVGEVVARYANRNSFSVRLDAYEDHPYRPFLHHEVDWGPLRHMLYTNSLGWKDVSSDRRVEKDSGNRLRIVFLGDSFAEGVGYLQPQTVSGRVERILNARGGGRRFEVLNGGRSSYCPLLEYQRLRRFLEAGYRADLVVVLPDVSDVFDEIIYGSQYELGPSREPLRFRERAYQPFLRTVYNYSALVRTTRVAMGRIVQAARSRPAPPAGAVETSGLPDTGALSAGELLALGPDQRRILQSNWMFHGPSLRGWTRDGMESLLSNLGWIDRLTRRSSIPLVVMTYPWPNMLYTQDNPGLYRRLVKRFPRVYLDREMVYGRRPGPRAFEYERRVQDFCRERAIPQVDLFPDFRRDPRWYELYIPGDVHFNEKGSQLAAERVSAAILAALAEGRTGAGSHAP